MYSASGLVLGLFLCFFMAGCAGLQAPANEEKNWQQYYEPIESLTAVNFAHDALAEAVRLYGPSFFPVQEIHIRQSVKRLHPARFSRADIVDWCHFVTFLAGNRDGYPLSRLWGSLSAAARASVLDCGKSGKVMSVGEQFRLLDDLNHLVQSRSFYDARYFAQFVATHPALSKPEARFRDLQGEQLERFNRRLVEAMFPAGVLLPFRERRWVSEGIELCEVIDPAVGRVVLYVSSPEGTPEFYLQLAHETLHLLNPLLYDWYVEGLGNVFAEQMALRNHLDWQPWQQRFVARREKDPYAIAYYMMREVVAVAGDDMEHFLRFAVRSGQTRGAMRLDIDGWLATLQPEKQKLVLAILKRYGPRLERYRGQRNAFVLPRLLAR